MLFELSRAVTVTLNGEPAVAVVGATTLKCVATAWTVILAFAVLPVPPSFELTLTLLFFTPGVVPCTFTETTQDPFAATVPPDRLTEPDAATAVAVPPQVSLRLGAGATCNPEGKVSVKEIPLNATLLFGLVMLKVSAVVPFTGIVVAPNALLMLGGDATTRVADALLPVPPFVELTGPAVFR